MKTEGLLERKERIFHSFKKVSECSDKLNLCLIDIEVEHQGDDGVFCSLVIDCPNKEIARYLWQQRSILFKSGEYLSILGELSPLILKIRGSLYARVPTSYSPISRSRDSTMISSAALSGTSRNYQYLTELINSAEDPIFVTFFSSDNWKFGQEIRTLFVSNGVGTFSGRSSFLWSSRKDDITPLYDRKDIESQMEILLREFRNSGSTHAQVKDLTYATYQACEDNIALIPKKSVKRIHNADFELFPAEEISGIIRVCRCKKEFEVVS
jgi:hypothetical protein